MLGAVALAGIACLTRVAPRKHDHFDRVQWLPDYASGLAAASASHKPLLLILVAGPRDGAC
jgi:hypothetical protein